MRIGDEFKMHKALKSKPKELCEIKFQRSISGSKQSLQIW